MLSAKLLLLPIVFPIAFGVILLLIPRISEKTRNILSFLASLINLSLVMFINIRGTDGSFLLVKFTEVFKIELGCDGFGNFFSILVSVLWPLSLLYAFEYMEKEKRQASFFAFFMMSLGAVLGVAYTKDLFSMYIFYELLSFFTFPLVMYYMTKEAMRAGRKYLTYMLGGAAFSLLGMIVVQNYTGNLDFKYGGVLDISQRSNTMILLFVIIFVGFSIKAAMMPFSRWLILAAVAPTPVTGLLHAVAVVKAGAFACIRVIYYIFGADYLRNTWGQYVIISLACITIVYGSVMAVKEPHIKKRLAYSTISNLSYILLAAAFMSSQGFVASLLHLTAHAVTKITLFFCIGSVMHITGKTGIHEIDGLGKKMKWIFVCFTAGSLSLTGIPQLFGFISKFRILEASVAVNSFWGYLGGLAVIVSAILTAIYSLSICVRAFFPSEGVLCENCESAHDPGLKMLIPIAITAVASIAGGFIWEPLTAAFTKFIL